MSNEKSENLHEQQDKIKFCVKVHLHDDSFLVASID